MKVLSLSIEVGSCLRDVEGLTFVYLSNCVCVCVCVRACARARVCVCDLSVSFEKNNKF